jgi:calcium-dependent protein kinase
MDSSQFVFHTHRIEEDYTLDDKKRLGEGGFGAVCTCEHKATKATRACKKIRKKDVKDKKAFEREVELQKSLDHPNICRIYDVYQDAKMYYIVLELCKGGELFDRIIQATHFGEHTVAFLAKQMIAALVYMHASCMAHRDLKPENYLLAQDLPVEDTHLKLIDFGMSRRFVKGTPMTTRVVTPYYVSPDVLSGKYTEACDMWSLGVIFYILFSGSPPFYSQYEGRKGDEDIFKKVKAGKYSFDSSEWKHVSSQARKFVGDILVMDPAKRPTAAQLLEHPWLVDHIPKSDPAPLTASAIDSLKQFTRKNKLQKAALHMVAKYVEDDHVNDLQKMFESMDKDGDGTLTIVEVKKGLHEAGLSELTAEMEQTMKELDTDGSGKIDYSEFLAATMDKKIYTQYDLVWQVFKQFDVDHSGTINKDNIATILTGGEVKRFEDAIGLQKNEIDEIMGKYDKDGSGDIDFDEFMALMTEGKNLIRAASRGSAASQ